jgi:hypothetical protein
MKFGWSKILVVVMASFIIMIVAMGIKMASTDQSLYEDDYYEKGEDHASRMTKELEAKHVELHLNRSSNSLQVSFDSMGFVNNIKLVKLSDETLDKEFNLTDSIPLKQATVNVGLLTSGTWILEVTGEVNAKPFFKKKQLAL